MRDNDSVAKSRIKPQVACHPDRNYVDDAHTKGDQSGVRTRLNRIFYDVDGVVKSSHPKVRDYRLESFNKLSLTKTKCGKFTAFSLENIDDVDLVRREEILFCQHDLYHTAVADQKKDLVNKYHYAKARMQLTHHWQALPSLNIVEKISKINFDPMPANVKAEIDIQYSRRDNLYYIKLRDESQPAQEICVNYIVVSKRIQKAPLSKALQILEEFCSQGFGESELNMSAYSVYHPDRPNGEDYLVEIGKQKQGACRHRSNLFKGILENLNLIEAIPTLAAKLKEQGVKIADLEGVESRFIGNDCHRYVEVKEKRGDWVRCDFGGYAADLVINNQHEDPSKQSKPVLAPYQAGQVDQQEMSNKTQKLKQAQEDEEIGSKIPLAENQSSNALSFNERYALSDLFFRRDLNSLESLDFGDRVLWTDELAKILEHAEQLKEIRFKQCRFSASDDVLTQEKQVPILPLPDLKNYFTKSEVEPAENISAYITALVQRLKTKRLVECSPEQLSSLSYRLEQFFQEKNQEYYVVRSARELMLRRPYVERLADNCGVIKKGLAGELYNFLKNPQVTLPRILIIDFSCFSASEVARFNSLLDDKPSIDGVGLPGDVQVICLTKQVENQSERDASLYSRFKQQVESFDISAEKCPEIFSPFDFENIDEQQESENTNNLEIDLYNGEGWKTKLLGGWRIHGAQLEFMPGKLLALLEKNTPPDKIILKNPPSNDPEFEQFFRDIKLKKKFYYQGRKYYWQPTNIVLINQLDFHDKNIIYLKRAYPDSKSILVNPSTFVGLFKQYEFEKTSVLYGLLSEKNGTLENYAKSSECAAKLPFTLYVSENLTAGQWSELLNECNELGIKLNIHLANSVTLPEALALQLDQKFSVAESTSAEIEGENLESVVSRSVDQCIATENYDVSILEYTLKKPKAICIDVSELSSSQLLTKTKGEVVGEEDNTHLQISQEGGALLELLDKSELVILHGKFSVDLRQRLQHLLHQRKNNHDPKGQIVIMANHKTVACFENISPIRQHQIADDHAIPAYQEREKARLNNWVGLKTKIPAYSPKISLRLAKAKSITEAIDQQRM